MAGRIISAATSGLGTFTHVYDTAGRLTSVTDPNTRTVGYQYDAASNRTRIDYPDGSYAVYAYDEMGRMTQVQYDSNDDSTAPAPSTVATYTYDNLSRRDNAALSNGTTTDPSYSTDGLVSDIIHTATGGNVTFTYGHDNSGLITNLTVSDDLFAPFTDIAGYHPFTPNSLNQYTSAMGEAIVHDLNGNMSSDGTNDYVHDAVNRLITATVGSTTWTYAYGPLDRRISKADGTNTIQYLYDNNRAVAEYNGSGTLLRKYIYGPGLDEPIMMIVPGDTSETVYYYHADSQGTIIGLTNDSGAWVEKYAYTLYGKPAAASTIGNPYMYTGRRLDAETGLYYYRARYYDPHLRRFIQTDPINYVGGMNLYAYVKNSPINFIDPLGLWTNKEMVLWELLETDSTRHIALDLIKRETIISPTQRKDGVRRGNEILLPVSITTNREAAIVLAHEWQHLVDEQNTDQVTAWNTLERETRAYITAVFVYRALKEKYSPWKNDIYEDHWRKLLRHQLREHIWKIYELDELHPEFCVVE